MIRRVIGKLSRLVRAAKPDDGRFDVWHAAGTEKDGGEGFSFVYAGLERHLNYFIARAFGGTPAVTSLGRLTADEIEAAALRNDPELPLVVYEAGSEKKIIPAADLKMPVWVRLETGLDGTPDSVAARSEFADARRFLKKYPIETEFDCTRAGFDEFFDGMYDPYIRKIKGDAAFVEDRAALLEEFKSGEILFARREGKRIGGMLVTLSGETGRLYCLGFAPEGEELARAGLVGAMYLIACKRLRERGAARANFGFTRGYLSDGAMRFKSRLGAAVVGEPHAESGFLYYRFLRETQALRRFLLKNPFLSFGPDGYRANYFTEDASSLDAAGVRALVKDRFCRGAEEVNVYSFKDASPAPVEPPAEKGIRRVNVLPSPIALQTDPLFSSR